MNLIKLKYLVLLAAATFFTAPAPAKPKPKASFKKFKENGIGAYLGYAYLGPGGGAEWFYRSTPKFELGANLVISDAEITSAPSGKAQIVIHPSMTMIKSTIRAFIKKTLYLSGGLEWAFLRGDYGYINLETNNRVSTDWSGSSMRLYAAVGNRWFLKQSWYLGVDWIGYSFPLFTSISANNGSQIDFFTGLSTSDTIKNIIDDQLTEYYLMVRIGRHF